MVLTKLTLSGAQKKDAVLEFKKGLNVISGDSDTGKTYAFQCLNYILGSSKEPKKIAEADGYDLITLDFMINDDFLTLERIIGSNKIDVINQGKRETLNCKHDARSTNNLSRYLLQLLLEHDDIIVLKNNNSNKKRTLSFRDIIHLCMVAETDIIGEISAFQSIQYAEKTAKESVLKYIITGIDDGKNLESDDVKIENIRRDGVVQFLLKKKIILKEQIEEIEQNESYQLYLNDNTIPEMIDKIRDLRKTISDYQFEITSNLKTIRAKKQHCFEDEVKISEFQKLRLHYVTELKKNGIISTHADFLTQLPHLGCPICNQKFNPNIITPENEEKLFLYFAEKRIELNQKIDDLDSSINDISARLETVSAEVMHLEEKNAQLYAAINKKQSILENLSKNIAIIRQLDEMSKSIDIYRQELISVERDILSYGEKVKRTISSSSVQNTVQYDAYCSLIKTVLVSWGFSEDIDISFDGKALDLYINKKLRSEWGKGYRAFIMSAMVVGLMRFCCENNLLHPGFVIIDSPLVSLKERKKESNIWVEDYMERKMIKDIFEQDYSRQVIIFENKSLQYNLNYNYVEFNHEGGNRKGFIP